MREGDRFFSFAFQFLIATVVLVAVFHFAFTADDEKLKAKSREIISLEQDLANASVRLAAMVQTERLRPVVARVFPSYRNIGTGRVISVGDLK